MNTQLFVDITPLSANSPSAVFPTNKPCSFSSLPTHITLSIMYTRTQWRLRSPCNKLLIFVIIFNIAYIVALYVFPLFSSVNYRTCILLLGIILLRDVHVGSWSFITDDVPDYFSSGYKLWIKLYSPFQ